MTLQTKTLLKPIGSYLHNLFLRWADQRSPRAKRVKLDQRRIFILPSASGIVWLLMCLIIFLFATNYKNSMAYTLCFFMVSLFMLAIFYTWWNLAGVVLVAKGGKPCFAGEKVEINIELQPNGRLRNGLTIGLLNSEHVLVSFDKTEVYSLLIPTVRRGWLQPDRMKVASVYPLGLCRAWSWVTLDFNCIIYPCPDFKYRLPASFAHSATDCCVTEDGVENFAGFRHYRNNDSLAHIDWKSYARTNELQSKQFDQPIGSEQLFSLDQVPVSSLEQKLSVITAWCLSCERVSSPYGLLFDGAVRNSSFGASHLQTCLEFLALYALSQST